ncbi:hypothetical protein LB465_01410 [Salegentibacter sp. LM13S]|uniref:hypothetical protein n=1 Tax=Salegentibacter lacus TaxID=2873599 RepID=UPI001CCC82AD|nr:hypothetical protein [Salegentibacter lacus]MBZ9629419.1 hypothetical protein [Salegentibacter lacus]
MNDSLDITNLTYKVFLEVHNLNLPKEMKFEDVKSKIEKISANIIQSEERHLNDIELQESIMRELIFDYCISKNYELDGFPFKQLEKIKNKEPGYDKDYFTREKTEYFLNRLSLKNKDILNLRSVSLQKYYPDCTAEEFKEKIKLYINLAEAENFSFDLTEKEIEEANRE